MNNRICLLYHRARTETVQRGARTCARDHRVGTFVLHTNPLHNAFLVANAKCSKLPHATYISEAHRHEMGFAQSTRKLPHFISIRTVCRLCISIFSFVRSSLLSFDSSLPFLFFHHFCCWCFSFPIRSTRRGARRGWCLFACQFFSLFDFASTTSMH